MDYGTPFREHVDALWEALQKRRYLIPSKGDPGYGHHCMYPWTADCDREPNIEEQRRRYWNTTPFEPGEREAILQWWSPPE
jgi:hypothetical protein